VSLLSFFSKRNKESKGLAQIPIIFGLLLMAIAIPVATKLSQQAQDTRDMATGCSGGDGYQKCEGSMYYVCIADQWDYKQTCSNGCDGNVCKTASCSLEYGASGSCGEDKPGATCSDKQKPVEVRSPSSNCQWHWTCLNKSECETSACIPDCGLNFTHCSGEKFDGGCGMGNPCTGTKDCSSPSCTNEKVDEGCALGPQCNDDSSWGEKWIKTNCDVQWKCFPNDSRCVSQVTPTATLVPDKCVVSKFDCNANALWKCVRTDGVADWEMVQDCDIDGSVCSVDEDKFAGRCQGEPTNTPTAIPTALSYACASGQVRCNGSSIEQCNSSRTGWDILTTCPGGCANNACAPTAVPPTPITTCKTPNLCKDTGGGRANCASYNMTTISGKSCPTGQVCCGMKPTPTPTPVLPTISSGITCSFDGNDYSVSTVICGKGGFFSRCKDGQKCTCGPDGKWQKITCPSGQCQNNSCTKSCQYQGQHYGQDDTVCDNNQNKAGTCSGNGQWIWISCDQDEYCSQGLCLSKKCCCGKNPITGQTSCALHSVDSCSQVSSSSQQSDLSVCRSGQQPVTSVSPSPIPSPQPPPVPTIKAGTISPGAWCLTNNSTYCGGSPAKQFLCVSNSWMEVAKCVEGCQGNNCAQVQNNCDYIIMEKIGQCGQFCNETNEIQYKVQTGKRLTDGTCEITKKCYPRAECTVLTGCTNGQLNGSSWCSAGRPGTCQNGQIDYGDPCVYGCQDGVCNTPQSVDQLKFTSNLTSEDFFTLDDHSLIAKHCEKLGGNQQQKDTCQFNTSIEDLIRGLDPELEDIVTDLRQMTLRKLDYLNMDSQSLAQKYCNGISACVQTFNSDNLLSGLSPQEIQLLKQQKANLDQQTKLQDFLTLNNQSLAQKYCQGQPQLNVCLASFNPESLLGNLSQSQKDELIKQKQATQTLSNYQTNLLVFTDNPDHFNAEEERYLVSQCLSLGGNCTNKQSALQFLLQLSAPQQNDSGYDLILANIEVQKSIQEKELGAYNRIAKTLTLLNIIDPQTGQLTSGYQDQTFQQLEQKLNDMKESDPTIRALLLYNNLTSGAAKRGIDIAYASDATSWDQFRGIITYAAPAGGMAATVAALPLTGLMGGAATLSYLGTGMGISGTVNSLSYTAESCGGPNMDKGQCGLAAARTGFMALSTGVGIAAQTANLVHNTATGTGLLWKATNTLGSSNFATGTGLKIANTVTSAFGTGLFGYQTVESYQQEGLSFNTFVNASVAVTSGARFVSSLVGNGTVASVANTTRTVVDNASDTVQVFVSCSQSFSDPSQIANCIADATAAASDVADITSSRSIHPQSNPADTVTDLYQRSLIADSDPVQRYIAGVATDILNTKLTDIDNQRLAAIKSLGDNPDVDAVKAVNRSFGDQIAIVNQNAKNNFAVDTYEATRLLTRIQTDGLKIKITDDQGNPRPIADIKAEVETTLKARNPIVADYVSTKLSQADIDALDTDGLIRLIATTGLPVKIKQDDGNLRLVDDLKSDVRDTLSRQVNQEAQIVADAVIAAKSTGQDLAYKNPDGSLIDFRDITGQALVDLSPKVQQDTSEPPSQPNIIQRATQTVADMVTRLAASVIPPKSSSSPTSVTASTDDILLVSDQINQKQLSIQPTTDDQGQRVYRLQAPDNAPDNIKIATDKVNQVISDFETDFTHPIRQEQLDLFLKPESIKQLQAGGGKTSVMAHLEASVKRNVVFVMPNQTDAESFVREVNSRQQFYKDQGLDVVYYDSQRGFLSLNDNFNIAKAKQISYENVVKLADTAGTDSTKHGLVIITTSSDNGWGLIRGKQNLASADGLLYDAVLGQRNFHLVVDEIGAQVEGEFSVSSGNPQKLSQLTNPAHMYGYLDSADMISASHLVDQIPEIDQLAQAVNQKLASGQSNQDLFFKYDGQVRPQPSDPATVNKTYASLIDSALVRSSQDISDDLKTKLQDLSIKLRQSGDESLRQEFTSILETISTEVDRSLMTDLSYMTAYLQSKWKILSMVPGNNFALEADGLVLRKLGGTSGERFSQVTDMIALQANGADMLRATGVDVSSGKIIPIEDLTYTPDSAKISNLEIFKAKAASGNLSGYDATPDTAASGIGVKATATSERPRQPSFFTKAQDMDTLIKDGINQDYLDANSGKALAVVIADEGVSYKITTDDYLSRQMELRGQTEITMARTKYKTELGGNQLTEYYLETVTRNTDGTIQRKITSSFIDQDAWSQKIHQLLAQDPQKITIVFEGRTRAVDLKVEDTSKNVAWQVIASDANTMEDITQSWKRNRVAASTGAAANWSPDDIDQFSRFSLLVRSTDDSLTADNVIDTYQQRLGQKLARDNFDTTVRQIAEAPKKYVDDIKTILKARSDYDQIAASLDLLSADVDRVARASIMNITYKPLNSDQIPDVVYNRGRLVHEQLKSGIDAIVDQYKLTDIQTDSIRQTAGLDQPFISKVEFNSLLDQPSRFQDLSLTGPNGLVKNWAIANTKDRLPQYAWSQPVNPQTVAQLDALDAPITINQSKLADIAPDLAQLNIPRGYDVNTGKQANWFQLTFNNWPGKDVFTVFDQTKSQIGSGQITTQEQLKQSLDQSLTPDLISDSNLRQGIIDQVLAGSLAQSLKSDIADKANILRTTPKGSQESQPDYQQRIDDKWQRRQALIDQANELGLDLDTSIGNQPWSTFEPRAQIYINRAQDLNQQAQDIGLDLSDGGPKTITQLSDLVIQKQAELATQTQITDQQESDRQQAITDQFNTSLIQIKSDSEALDLTTDNIDTQNSNLITLTDQLQSLQDLI